MEMIIFTIFVIILMIKLNRQLIIENLVLRQQLAIMRQSIKRPRIRKKDRDSIYGKVFRNRVKHMGIKEVISAPKSPWQNSYVERMIGSVRKDCLDYVIVLNEKHLKRILTEYFEYYHFDRTHLGLSKDTPFERPVKNKPKNGGVIAFPRVSGLHHRYEWRKAA